MNVRYVLFCLLNMAAIGCGSDDGNSAQTDNASAAASAGHLSPRPAGAKDSAEHCIETTAQLFTERSDGYGDECVKCVCNLSPESVASCNEQADQCWGVLACVRESCAGLNDTEETSCAVEKCGESSDGTSPSVTLAAFIGGNLCSNSCASN